MTPSQPLRNPAQGAQARWHLQVGSWLAQQADAEPVQAARLAALAHFAEAQMPMPRHEDWKYTRLNGLWRQELDWSLHGEVDMAAAAALSRHASWPEAVVLTLVDGRFVPQLSTPASAWPQGLTVQPILSAHLPAVAGDDYQDALEMLAVASVTAGWQVEVASGVMLGRPLVLQQLGVRPLLTQSATVRVMVGRGAALDMIELLSGAPGGLVFSRVSVSLGEGAQCRHAIWQDAGADAHVFGWRNSSLSRDARYVQRALWQGGLVSRQWQQVCLQGENAEADVSSASLASGQQVRDVRTHTRHASANARSRQWHRLALAGQGNGVFHGYIRVDKGADKTDADMATHNLLLSPQAQANTKPQLEIYADDVRCTHGATSGFVDEAQVFYLRARGIAAAQARLLVAGAFASAPVSDVFDSVLAQQWAQAINAQLLPAVQEGA